MEYKQVVTSFLQRGQLLLLLLRSNEVGTYQGKWGAVSGFLEQNEDPYERAKIEISEETALTSKDLLLIRSGELLRIYDQEKDIVWIVHPFLFTTHESAISVNWENSQYKWVEPDDLANFETVPSLRQTFDRVRWDLSSPPANLSKAIAIVDEIAHDKINGASYLGRKAIEAIHTAARLSTAQTNSDLFRDVLMIVTKMRIVQPNMASIRNTAGRLLHDIDSGRQTSRSVAEYRNLVEQMAREALANCISAAELVSRNLRSMIIRKHRILTHSYSSTVKSAIQLCRNSELQVYVTESGPGFEGKTLARELTDLGFNTTVLPDTTTGAFPIRFDAVLLGADSILADGSIINKIGTKDIARTAQRYSIPVYVAAERSKLDTLQFLGSPLSINGIFDLTPGEFFTSIITEQGEMKPSDAKDRIESLVRELYT
ncbi:MAG TPA: NUDIX domain-containing protein [Candidatus Bathyarchaeia archaeon]|nr:NUDIX domain-containing protein [Candidatus Bathyarchaeia archaeon]